jgi:hypothetical protein
MPEDLHNAGPTFCRMTNAALKDQVGRNVLSYVDDIVVASKKKTTYISDLAETFTNMRKARLKLNPEKWILESKEAKSLDVQSPWKESKQTLTRLEPSFRCNLCKIEKKFTN